MAPDTDLKLKREVLEHVLGEQLQRIRRRFLLHGLGWLIACIGLVAAGYYLVDRTLDLPGPVRVLVTLVAALYLARVVQKRVLYPLHRAFTEIDVAIAIERRFPELQERLISAIQLGRSAADQDGLRNQSEAMVRQLVEEAAQETRTVPLDRLLEPRRTVHAWSTALLLMLVLGSAALTFPTNAVTFIQRALGMGVDYPRDTSLYLELQGTDEVRVEYPTRGRAVITLAAGADLPVLVRAEGVVPDDVELVLDEGRGLPSTVSMTRRDNNRFRYVFRRLRSELRFHARGGDDENGDIEVTVRTIRPPQVQQILVALDYPAYTGREQEVVTGGGIEALVGSRATLTATMTSEVSSASLSFTGSGEVIPMLETRFEEEGSSQVAFTCSFEVRESDSYQLDMVSPEGLSNPRPGTYPVTAIPDHAPVGVLLQPTTDDLHVVLPGALIPLRVECTDDFGLTGVRAELVPGRQEEGITRELLGAPADAAPVRERVLTELVEVGEVLGTDTGNAGTGDTIEVKIRVQDNREGAVQTNDLAPRQVHVVGPDDLARRISGQFRRIRDEVDTAREQQQRLADKLRDTREELAGGTSASALGDLVLSIGIGESSVLTAVRRIHRELMRSFDLHLFNRLEESIHARRVIELYRDYHRENEIAEAFLPGYYRMLGEERRSGRLGSMEKTLDPILEMTLAADRLIEELGLPCVAGLDRALVAESDADLGAELDAAQQLQDQILAGLENLFALLGDWNEFQDVISNVRSLRDRQKELEARTRGIGGK